MGVGLKKALGFLNILYIIPVSACTRTEAVLSFS